LRLQFDPKRGLIVVPVWLVGPAADLRVNLALDTGATATMVSREAATLLGHDLESATDHADIVTGSGEERAPRVVMTTVAALGVTRGSMGVVCHTMPATASVDGVLGLDFFRGRVLVIDLIAGTVEVSEKPDGGR
jgi:hypothetical protein